MKLALKVDVATLRGAREGVPALVNILERHGAGATFFFCVGPDHTGRIVGRALPPGSAHSMREHGLAARYGIAPLLYGTLLPAPAIGRRARQLMRSVVAAGFETGVQAYDAVRWRRVAARGDAPWTDAEMQRAVDGYTEALGERPRAIAAAGWQTSAHALRLTQRLGFDYCSDGRGRSPHLPVWNAELIRCPQFPTTLPTLVELIGADGIVAGNVAAHLLERTGAGTDDQVFTLYAELEGRKLAQVFEQLVVGWKAQGYTLVALRSLYESVDPMALPRCEVGLGTVPGRTGTLLVQGAEFLADVELARAA